jgi:hypothetical protein
MSAATQRLCGLRVGWDFVLKDIAFQTAKRLARTFLRWSSYWADVAEWLHTGQSISDIRKERK